MNAMSALRADPSQAEHLCTLTQPDGDMLSQAQDHAVIREPTLAWHAMPANRTAREAAWRHVGPSASRRCFAGLKAGTTALDIMDTEGNVGEDQPKEALKGRGAPSAASVSAIVLASPPCLAAPSSPSIFSAAFMQ